MSDEDKAMLDAVLTVERWFQEKWRDRRDRNAWFQSLTRVTDEVALQYELGNRFDGLALDLGELLCVLVGCAVPNVNDWEWQEYERSVEAEGPGEPERTAGPRARKDRRARVRVVGHQRPRTRARGR